MFASSDSPETHLDMLDVVGQNLPELGFELSVSPKILAHACHQDAVGFALLACALQDRRRLLMADLAFVIGKELFNVCHRVHDAVSS